MFGRLAKDKILTKKLAELEVMLECGNRPHLTIAHAYEREAALEYLCSYWKSEDPDDATIVLLEKIAQNSPDRDFLVSILNAQINFGFIDEFVAMCAVDDWDDEHEHEDDDEKEDEDDEF